MAKPKKMTAQQAVDWLVGQKISGIEIGEEYMTIGFQKGYLVVDGDFDVSVNPEDPTPKVKEELE